MAWDLGFHLLLYQHSGRAVVAVALPATRDPEPYTLPKLFQSGGAVWRSYEMELREIWLLDFYGGAHIVPVDQYFQGVAEQYFGLVVRADNMV